MSNYFIIPIFVPHKGCPHNCIFCNQKKITGSEKDITPIDVKETIDTVMSTINRKDSYIELSFFGGSFTGIPREYQKSLLEVALVAKDKGLIQGIRLSTRPDYIDDSILTCLKAYKVDVIELGVQSMDKEVLQASERGHSPEDVVKAVNLIKEYGFTLGLQMMIGLPLDNLEKDIYTARRIIELKPDFIRIYPSLVIRDTYLEELYEKGLYTPLRLDEAIAICKQLYIEFTNNNIQIIRLGLQTTTQISMEGDVISGPFHPAFRELVEGSILNDMVEYVLNNYYGDKNSIIIEISPKDISKLFADKKRFYQQTLNKFNDKKIEIRQNSFIERLTLGFITHNKERNMSLYEYINISR